MAFKVSVGADEEPEITLNSNDTETDAEGGYVSAKKDNITIYGETFTLHNYQILIKVAERD